MTVSPGLAWLVGGLALMVAEALLPGAFMVWVGLAALCTGVMTYALDPGFAGEVVAFALFAALAVALGLRVRKPRRAAGLNTPSAGLVGRTAHALVFEGREGRVRLGDSDWPARLPLGTASAPEPSAVLDVVGLDGTVLLVRLRADGA